jgi:hypothetical protein
LRFDNYWVEFPGIFGLAELEHSLRHSGQNSDHIPNTRGQNHLRKSSSGNACRLSFNLTIYIAGSPMQAQTKGHSQTCESIWISLSLKTTLVRVIEKNTAHPRKAGVWRCHSRAVAKRLTKQ